MNKNFLAWIIFVFSFCFCLKYIILPIRYNFEVEFKKRELINQQIENTKMLVDLDSIKNYKEKKSEEKISLIIEVFNETNLNVAEHLEFVKNQKLISSPEIVFNKSIYEKLLDNKIELVCYKQMTDFALNNLQHQQYDFAILHIKTFLELNKRTNNQYKITSIFEYFDKNDFTVFVNSNFNWYNENKFTEFYNIYYSNILPNLVTYNENLYYFQKENDVFYPSLNSILESYTSFKDNSSLYTDFFIKNLEFNSLNKFEIENFICYHKFSDLEFLKSSIDLHPTHDVVLLEAKNMIDKHSKFYYLVLKANCYERDEQNIKLALSRLKKLEDYLKNKYKIDRVKLFINKNSQNNNNISIQIGYFKG